MSDITMETYIDVHVSIVRNNGYFEFHRYIWEKKFLSRTQSICSKEQSASSGIKEK